MLYSQLTFSKHVIAQTIPTGSSDNSVMDNLCSQFSPANYVSFSLSLGSFFFFLKTKHACNACSSRRGAGMGVRLEIETNSIKNRRQEQGSKMESLVSPVLISLLLICSHLVAAHGSASHREASCTVNVRPTLPPSPLHHRHLPTSCPSIQASLSLSLSFSPFHVVDGSLGMHSAFTPSYLEKNNNNKENTPKGDPPNQLFQNIQSACIKFLTVLQNLIHQLGTSSLEKGGKASVEKKKRQNSSQFQKQQSMGFKHASRTAPPVSRSYHAP